jgi:hypothetical protein
MVLGVYNGVVKYMLLGVYNGVVKYMVLEVYKGHASVRMGAYP